MQNLSKALTVVTSLLVLLAGQPVSAGTPGETTTGRIWFTQTDGHDQEIFSMEPDGSDIQQFTDNDVYDGEFEWSPDGTQLLVARVDGAYIVDRQGEDVRTLDVAGADHANHFSWSPDATKLAYARFGDRGTHIYTVRADGSRPSRRLEEVRGAFPVWTSDGKRLIFSRRCGPRRCPDPTGEGHYGLFSVRLDGTHLRRITGSARFDYPQDMASRDRLLMKSMGDSYAEDDYNSIYRMRLGRSEPNLIKTPSVAESHEVVAWSPDARQIVTLNSGAEGPDYDHGYIHIVNRDGTGATLIMECVDEDRASCPQWIDWAAVPTT